ncbi:hypothetical protein TRFO_24401 [Tritrichomonas foetus]|uniref:DNA-directed DNA polymerase family A palm domain-containing protein n=1 Tax=Tritrichomonas foetus TaxID=1144522 RepID=A0A1J4K852_9EUKA|nr:hypothetical protein TRFO_24401 [Tritrichomonas foetus]|eukprot:OHT07387.1 hypothetical protein TRFO_24401 [Tritrichomonas foetus]
MTEEFPYEVLFRFVFPDWKGPIPELPQTGKPVSRNFQNVDNQTDSSQCGNITNDGKNEKIIVDGLVIWEIRSKKLSNINFNKQNNSRQNSISEVFIHLEDRRCLHDSDSIVYSDTCVHFLPNSTWVFQLDPTFHEEIPFFDPIIAKWLLNTESLVRSDILQPMNIFFESFDINGQKRSALSDTQARSVYCLFRPFSELFEILRNNDSLFQWHHDVEIPHSRILGRMHEKTLAIDREKMEEEKSRLTKVLNDLEKEIYSLAGVEFNILSPFEVSDILFNKMHLSDSPDQNPNNVNFSNVRQNNSNHENMNTNREEKDNFSFVKNGLGAESCFSIDSRHRLTRHRDFAPANSNVLEHINHPIAKKILKYRKIQKVISNWLSFTEFCDENGSLHPDFLVCSTATGRISTKCPNLQNIPSMNENDQLFGLNIRSMFLPYPSKLYCTNQKWPKINHNSQKHNHDNQNPNNENQTFKNDIQNYENNNYNFDNENDGNVNHQDIAHEDFENEKFVLISLDYSQLELRILTHFSKDPSLFELCCQTGIDIHTHIAKIIFSSGSTISISSKQREEAKQAVYATIYGKGWSKDGFEKGEKLEAVLNSFPGIREFALQTTALATNEGLVKTLSGKIRRLPNIKSQVSIERKRDQRIALNTKIQGSAADFVKFALLRIMEKCGDRVEPLLQIHDEWLFRTKLIPETQEFVELCWDLKNAAECHHEIGISVPIPCKISYGRSYGELTELLQE